MAAERYGKLEKQLSQKDEELKKVTRTAPHTAMTNSNSGWQSRAQLEEREEQRVATQAELDDLLMVFGDLEEKVEKYKVSCCYTPNNPMILQKF